MNRKCSLIVILILIVILNGWSLAEDIHEAAKTGDLQLLKKILDKDPSLVESTDTDKMTPLHHAIDAGHLKAASLLIASGADIDAVNYKKETPLHIAAYGGNAEAVKLLLKHGADPALREMRDRIPLFLACNWGRDLETVWLLIDAGSDVNDKNSRGEIVLVSTLYYGKKEIIDLLIDRGATLPDDEDTLRRVLYITASNGMERPFNIAVEKSKKQGLEWWTGIPMQACARGGSIFIAKTLIAKGANFKEKNIYGVEPLHIAAENGRLEFVEFLLSKGADMDSPSLIGKTALHYAQENGHNKLADLLITKGASQALPKFPILKGDYLGQEKPGETPLMFAPGIVSGHGFDSEHSPPVFSPDGKEVYWTQKFRGPILYMKQEKGVWTAPKPVSPLINACDLHWLFSVATNGTIYFASPREGGFGANDIYSSKLTNGKYEEPKNLGNVINTAGIDHTPFIAPDESYLIFVSRGRSASPGDFQFYISYKDEDGSWKDPIDLSQKINSLGSALCPAVTPDEKYMFFIGQGDIYWVDAGFIDKLRPKK